MGRRCTLMETSRSPLLLKSPPCRSYCYRCRSHGCLLIDVWCWLIGHSFVLWIPSPYAFTVTCSFPFFLNLLSFSISPFLPSPPCLCARLYQKRDILKTQKHLTTLVSPPEYKRMEDQGSRFLLQTALPLRRLVGFCSSPTVGSWAIGCDFYSPCLLPLRYFCHFSVFSITSLFFTRIVSEFQFFFYAVRFSILVLVDIFRRCHRPLSWHTRSLFLLWKHNSINTSLLFPLSLSPLSFS